MLEKSRWFQKSATAVMIIFFGIMAVVTVAAYTRRSGHTGLDMAKIQKLRYPIDAKQLADSK
jgi:hypothetical protein